MQQELAILGQMAVAMVLGAVVGWEREASRKLAGIRTHMLVAGVAALLPMLGEQLNSHYELELGYDTVRSDPLRLFVAVVTGVSFLGAGTIIRRGKGETEGLTTAASLLFAAAIGISVALSRWILAGGATALALLTLRGRSFLERRINPKPNTNSNKPPNNHEETP